MSNAVRSFTKDIISCLLGNISTMSTHNTTLKAWTDSTRALTEGWTTDADDAKARAWIDSIKDSKSMSKVLSEAFGLDDLKHWSSALMTELMQKLSQKDPLIWDKDAGPVQMNTINQLSSLIQSTGTRETAIGDTSGKAQANIIQQDTSAQQPQADAGSSVSGVLGAFAALLDRAF